MEVVATVMSIVEWRKNTR